MSKSRSLNVGSNGGRMKVTKPRPTPARTATTRYAVPGWEMMRPSNPFSLIWRFRTGGDVGAFATPDSKIAESAGVTTNATRVDANTANTYAMASGLNKA